MQKGTKNIHNSVVTQQNISQFFGLLLVSCYHNLPSENDCWYTTEEMETPIYSKTISRENF